MGAKLISLGGYRLSFGQKPDLASANRCTIILSYGTVDVKLPSELLKVASLEQGLTFVLCEHTKIHGPLILCDLASFPDSVVLFQIFPRRQTFYERFLKS